jgi:hypothetical protein
LAEVARRTDVPDDCVFALERPSGRDADGANRRARCAARVAHAASFARRALRRSQRAGSTLLSASGPEGGDAVLYGLAALFALVTALVAGLSAYRDWGWFALGPYAGAAAVSAWLGRRRKSRTGRTGATSAGSDWGPGRVWILLFLLVGATLAPLSAEVALRNDGPASAHVQPEVVVIAQAGARVIHGEHLYETTVHDGHVHAVQRGEPTYESFFPYLPLMAAFGLPNLGKGPVRVTDTRVLFSIVTLIVVGAALLALRAPKDAKMRALQFLTVLPSAALPLATGGDDMPIVAFLLLAMVLAQRRQPGWSGIVLGVASAMKFTAWPLAAVALWCARDREGRRAPGRMLLGMVAVAGPVVAPFAVSEARGFFDNVILFPLGLSGVASPAASNLPGHVLVTELPWLHAALPVAVALIGGALLVWRLWRRPPATPAEVATLAGWIMLVAILFAPATRVGYLLYPADFFVWGWMFAAADRSGGEGSELSGWDAREPSGPDARELRERSQAPGGVQGVGLLGQVASGIS